MDDDDRNGDTTAVAPPPFQTPTPNPDFMSSWIAGNSSLSNLDLNNSVSGMSVFSGVGGNRARSMHILGVGVGMGVVPAAPGGPGGSPAVMGGRANPTPLSASLPPQGDGGCGGIPPALISPLHHASSGRGISLGMANADSAMHDAARVTNWSEVLRLCTDHPLYARFVGPDGWTALHHSLGRRGCPLEVVEALIRAYPGALTVRNENRWTPLHFACRFKAPASIVHLLIHEFPARGVESASMRCSKGRTPLYYAVRYDADWVEEMLLVANPGAVLDEDRDGVSPLALVWDKYATRLEGKQALVPYLQSRSGGAGEDVGGGGSGDSNGGRAKADADADADAPIPPLSGKLKERWERANRLLRAAFHFPAPEGRGGDQGAAENGDGAGAGGDLRRPLDFRGRKWRILHAAAAIRCHITLFELACVLHPEQAFELDKGDLYGTATATALYKNGAVDDGLSAAASPGSPRVPPPFSQRTALHFAALSPVSGRSARSVITSLLSLNPGAASTADGVDGSLPLHLLAENEARGHWVHDGARDLAEAYPDAIRRGDDRGRLPLHRACAVLARRGEAGAGAGALGFNVDPTESAAEALEQAQALPTAQADAQQQQQQQQPEVPPPSSEVVALASVVRNLIALHPRGASIPDDDGALPLHVIAMNARGWDADAEAVLIAHPPAVRSRTGPSLRSRLPIHLAAAGTNACWALIARLVEAHPRAASQEDGAGKLPLHLACESGKTWEHGGTGVIYEAFPTAIRTAESNGRGWIALHMAAVGSVGKGEGLMNKLIKLYPDAAAVRDSGMGRFPLHWACKTARPWEGVIELIFHAYPDAAISQDNRGWLPFHLAAISSSKDHDLSAVTSWRGGGVEADRIEKGEEEELTKVNIIYHLVREAPIVLKI